MATRRRFSNIPMAGGGGHKRSLIHQVLATLTHAQITALPTSPVEIIPAQADRVFWPIFACAHFNWVADYGSIDANAQMSLNTTSGAVSTILSQGSQGFISQFFACGGPSISAIFTVAQRVGESGNSFVTADTSFFDTDVVEKAMLLAVYNGGTGDFTLGDPDNSLDISVIYTVFNVVTGAFE